MKAVTAAKLREHYVVVDGAPLESGSAVICALFQPALQEGAYVSQVFWFEESQWFVGPMLGFEAVSLACDPNGSGVFILGREGNVARVSADKTLEELVIADDYWIGSFRRMRVLGADVVAIGETRSIFQLRSGIATRISGVPNRPELSAGSEEDMVADIIADSDLLFDADGHSARDLIAVGSDGGIWRLGHDELQRLDSPTNLPLYCITTCGSDVYCIGGRAGLVLIGNESHWAELASVEGFGDICSIASFRSRLYVCDGREIRVSPSNAVKFSSARISNGSALSHALRVHAGSLLSIAVKEVYLTLDGEHWTHIL